MSAIDIPPFSTAQLRGPYAFQGGDWLTLLGKDVKGNNSLFLYHPTMIDIEWGSFDPRGVGFRRARLTAAGIAVRAALDRGAP